MGYTNTEIIEELLSELTSAANFIRGAALDPRIPKDTKDAFLERAKRIDKTCEIYRE